MTSLLSSNNNNAILTNNNSYIYEFGIITSLTLPNTNLNDSMAIGTTVGTLTYTYSSAPINITYSLSGNSNFSINSLTGVISTASLLTPGTETMTVYLLQKNEISFQQNISITIATEIAPTVIYFSPISPKDTVPLGTVIGTATASDTSNIYLWSLTNNASGKYSIDPQTGIVTVVSSLKAETDIITILVQDGTLSYSQSFNINVIPNPILSLTQNNVLTNASGTQSVGTVSVTDLTGTISWTISGSSYFSINNSGIISASAIIPNSNQTITVTATNGTYTATNSFLIIITPVYIISFTPAPVYAGSPASTVGTATVTNMGAPTWTITGSSDFTISSAGVVSAIANIATSGSVTFTITATENGATATNNYTITVEPSTTPVITFSSITLFAGQSYVQTLGTATVSNIATGTLTWTLSNSPDFAINSSGVVTSIVNISSSGTVPITILVTNGTLSANGSFNVVVEPYATPVLSYTSNNLYPGFSFPSSFVAPLGTAHLQNTNDSVVWSISNNSLNTSQLSINSNTGLVTVPLNGGFDGGVPQGVFSGVITAISNGSTYSLSITETIEIPTNYTNTDNLVIVAQPNVYGFPNNIFYGVDVQNSKVGGTGMKWGVVTSDNAITINYAGFLGLNYAASVPSGNYNATIIATDPTTNSTVVSTITIPIYATPTLNPTVITPTYDSLPTTGYLYLPTFSTSGICGVNIINATATNSTQDYINYCQFFKIGDVPTGSYLVLNSASGIITTQIEVRNLHSDGSVKSASITILHPVIAANTTLEMWYTTTTVAPSGTNLSLLTGLGTNTLTVSYNIHDITGVVILSNTIDIISQFNNNSSSISYWRQGPLVTEGRISIPISNSFYLNCDMSVYSDGSIACDIQFNNDYVMQATGNAIYYDGAITLNGVVDYSWSDLFQAQYQDWHKITSTKPANFNRIQVDSPYLSKSATIQPYNYPMGVTIIGANGNFPSGFDYRPLSANSVQNNMGGVGVNRYDIGYTTGWATFWLMSGDPRWYDCMQANADTAGSITWNYYDPTTSHFLNLIEYPDLWSDGRGGTGTPNVSTSTGLTQPPYPNCVQGWAPEYAHQPDLNFVSYIANGSRWNYDRSFAQTCWSMTIQYPPARNLTTTYNGISYTWNLLLIYQNQVRGTAWSTRQVSNGLWMAHTSDTFYISYFENILNQNQQYFNLAIQYEFNNSTSPLYQGEILGYLAMEHGNNNFAPWEQNYLSGIVALMTNRNYIGWSAINEFFLNFTINSFLTHTTDTPYNSVANAVGALWHRRNGAAYELFVGNPNGSGSNLSGTLATTWAELEFWTVYAKVSNGNETIDSQGNVIQGIETWNFSNGDYGQLCMASLVWGIIFGLPNAQTAYDWLSTSGCPYLDTNVGNQQEPVFSLTPIV